MEFESFEKENEFLDKVVRPWMRSFKPQTHYPLKSLRQLGFRHLYHLRRHLKARMVHFDGRSTYPAHLVWDRNA